jgi:hypothetical protein
MEQVLLPTIEANRKGNLKNERTYLLSLGAPGPPPPQTLRVAGLVQHRIDRGFARSIQAVRRIGGKGEGIGVNSRSMAISVR